MNRKVYYAVGLIFVLFLVFYFLIWPFINSAISNNLYIRVSTDGSPSHTYISDIRTGSNLGAELTVQVYGRNNVATQKQSEDGLETYQNYISDATLKNVRQVVDDIKGMHLFVRRRPGYTYAYDSNSFGNIFFSPENKKIMRDLSQILEYIARGDEYLPDSKKITYEVRGQERLKNLMDDMGLYYQES